MATIRIDIDHYYYTRMKEISEEYGIAYDLIYEKALDFYLEPFIEYIKKDAELQKDKLGNNAGKIIMFPRQQEGI